MRRDSAADQATPNAVIGHAIPTAQTEPKEQQAIVSQDITCYNPAVTGIEHFEAFVEQLIERAFGKIFSPPLHWSDLVHNIARVMENECLITDGQFLFPDRYRIILHPADWEALKDGQEELLSGLYQCLYRLAEEAGGRFAAQPSILMQLEPRVASGCVEVHAAWTDGASLSDPVNRAVRTQMDDTRPTDPAR